MKKPVNSAKTIRLAPTQQDCPANFSDASFDYPNESFEQVTRRLLGSKGFPKTKTGAAFKKVCRQVFNRERRK
jgi:hypothetical protein